MRSAKLADFFTTPLAKDLEHERDLTYRNSESVISDEDWAGEVGKQYREYADTFFARKYVQIRINNSYASVFNLLRINGRNQSEALIKKMIKASARDSAVNDVSNPKTKIKRRYSASYS